MLRRILAGILIFLVLVSVSSSVLVGRAGNVSVNARSSLNVESLAESTPANVTSLIVVVFVNSSVFQGVKSSVEQYESDLKDFGYEDVVVLNWSDPDPAHIRKTLSDFYINSSLAGALLVGDIPAADFEMMTEWDYERFPMDLYYMDLDGNWTDSDNDGVFDQHLGKKIAPEIWVGRIKTSGLGEDEVSLINSYFDKNHRYRRGLLSAPKRALLYIDDDWENYASMDSYSLGLLYENVTQVTDKAETNAEDYKARINQGYEWVHLRAHGDWDYTTFEMPNGTVSNLLSQDYVQINPSALFYQLFVCKAARFTKPQYQAGELVFRTDSALLAISSTKIGGMLMYWTFYEALAKGRTIGDAFKKWFVEWGEGKVLLQNIFVGKKWFYGLAIIGDPTLRLNWLDEAQVAELQKYEEQVIHELPLVQQLWEQVESTNSTLSSLQSEYAGLQDSYSTLQTDNVYIASDLWTSRTVLYFFIITTVLLAAAYAHISITRPKPADEL